MSSNATESRFLPRLLMSPAVVTLLIWMLVPLGMTIYFSLIRYNLMSPEISGFAGWENYDFFITNPAFMDSVFNTLILLGSVVIITVGFGLAIALLINSPFPGQSFVRILLISPFFVMPTVNALLWKHMMMNPIYGVFAQISGFFGLEPIDWLTEIPLGSIIIMLSWQWMPFACLIFITALQSMDREQLEASRMDGATYFQQLRFLYLPHMARSIAVVIMIEVIFLLSVFAEIFTTTSGGPGTESTNLAFLIFQEALMNFDVGAASAGAIFAIILANVVAIILIRMIGKNLDN
ncbi:carbohydrate ABC transporter permease [uncultured Cocleimonas sp.]|uniref:carbohydrate ABC transporter permease n=1 Tax=uncultured Cocleimonas sp. TaxID=1051587 RepID=UPI00260C4FE8|nr:sugar ABC transporter permease [uncultured Cocleimonas sp.]